jgi:glycosyltransferase involved in cell wall biosynthesis
MEETLIGGDDGRMDEGYRRSIIQIVDYGGPYSGNFIASVLTLNEVLKKAGLKQVMIFSVIAKDRPWIDKLLDNNIPVYFLPARTSLSVAREISRIADKEHAVVLHSHFTTFDVAAWFAAVCSAARQRKLNVVWHKHSAFPVRKSVKREIKDLVKYRFMGRFVKIITVSEELKQSFTDRGFAGESNVILNGVDIDRATKTDKTSDMVRRDLGIPSDSILLLSYGWEPITKGIDVLLQALVKLCDEAAFTALLVGDDRLKEFIFKFFGRNVPNWLRIAQPRDNVAELYKAADIFVSASRWEGCPYSIMEAMANGLPIISSDIHGLDWAKNAGSLKFFDSEDSEGLAQAIKQVINMRLQDFHSIADANIELINTNYSVGTWATNIYSIYKQILKKDSLFYP